MYCKCIKNQVRNQVAVKKIPYKNKRLLKVSRHKIKRLFPFYQHSNLNDGNQHCNRYKADIRPPLFEYFIQFYVYNFYHQASLSVSFRKYSSSDRIGTTAFTGLSFCLQQAPLHTECERKEKSSYSFLCLDKL